MVKHWHEQGDAVKPLEQFAVCETQRMARTPHILVVDDEKTLRLVLSRAMQKEAYNVISASDGAECLALCQQQLPDLILLDALMPVMDGFACCAELQQQFGNQCPPVLMITSLEDQMSVDLAFEVGASDYVTKPIHWAVLRQRVRRLLQMHWTIAELQQKMEQERRLMAQLEAANHTLKRLAAIDGLTQIANRRCFDQCLRREWQRLTREQAPLSLILCDIDSFKRYNDTYGHRAGDACLQQVARLIQQQVGQARGLAARYGGEEFVLILPNQTAEQSAAVARSLQTDLRTQAIPAVEVGQIVTLSFGVASMIPTELTAATALLVAADRALYQAKQAGRDRIVIHDGAKKSGL